MTDDRIELLSENDNQSRNRNSDAFHMARQNEFRPCFLTNWTLGTISSALGSRLADGRAQVPIAIICVLMCSMFGQLLGVWVAGHLRRRLVSGRGHAFDAGVGAVLGVVSVLLVAWMVAVPLASCAAVAPATRRAQPGSAL